MSEEAKPRKIGTGSEFDCCVVGIVERMGQECDILCYDYHRVLGLLQIEHGMTYADAVEYFQYNIVGAWMGPGTPCFINLEQGVDDLSDM